MDVFIYQNTSVYFKSIFYCMYVIPQLIEQRPSHSVGRGIYNKGLSSIIYLKISLQIKSSVCSTREFFNKCTKNMARNDTNRVEGFWDLGRLERG